MGPGPAKDIVLFSAFVPEGKLQATGKCGFGGGNIGREGRGRNGRVAGAVYGDKVILVGLAGGCLPVGILWDVGRQELAVDTGEG